MSVSVIESAAIEWAKAHAHRFNDARLFGEAVAGVYTAAKAAMRQPVIGAVVSAAPLLSGETRTGLAQSPGPLRSSLVDLCAQPPVGAEGSN